MVTPMSAGIRAAVFATLCAALLGACRLSTELPALATATYTVGQPPAFTASSTTTPVPAGSATVGPSPSAVAAVESLKATVSADLLSCRYGPGPEYLFLYGLRKGANIILIGRTDAENWHWAYVQGKSPCWVKTDFLDVHGEWLSLPVVYPGLAKLPISPYYPATTVLSATRQKDKVTVRWLDVPLRPGDAEDDAMQRYVVEVWRCQDRHLLFEPLATNQTSITIQDQPGCSEQSHGRIFVQEKHGFAGPAEIPWPRP